MIVRVEGMRLDVRCSGGMEELMMRAARSVSMRVASKIRTYSLHFGIERDAIATSCL